MPDKPILRATDAMGEVYDDPSEDALFMFIEDLTSPGSSVSLERLGPRRRGEFVRVSLHEDHTYEIDGSGIEAARSSESMRAVHEAVTRWAFDMPEWQEPLS